MTPLGSVSRETSLGSAGSLPCGIVEDLARVQADTSQFVTGTRQLLPDRLEVEPDRLFADLQARRHLTACEACGDERDDITLAIGERFLHRSVTPQSKHSTRSVPRSDDPTITQL